MASTPVVCGPLYLPSPLSAVRDGLYPCRMWSSVPPISSLSCRRWSLPLSCVVVCTSHLLSQLYEMVSTPIVCGRLYLPSPLSAVRDGLYPCRVWSSVPPISSLSCRRWSLPLSYVVVCTSHLLSQLYEMVSTPVVCGRLYLPSPLSAVRAGLYLCRVWSSVPPISSLSCTSWPPAPASVRSSSTTWRPSSSRTAPRVTCLSV